MRKPDFGANSDRKSWRLRKRFSAIRNSSKIGTHGGVRTRCTQNQTPVTWLWSKWKNAPRNSCSSHKTSMDFTRAPEANEWLSFTETFIASDVSRTNARAIISISNMEHVDLAAAICG